jgi:hypothetical protein
MLYNYGLEIIRIRDRVCDNYKLTYVNNLNEVILKIKDESIKIKPFNQDENIYSNLFINNENLDVFH